MGSKNISVRDDVYRRLRDAKSDDESFSDAIDRLLSVGDADHPLYELVGTLDDDEADRVRERAQEFRAQLDEEMDG
jgi:predicted CopG family antitoxin